MDISGYFALIFDVSCSCKPTPSFYVLHLAPSYAFLVKLPGLFRCTYSSFNFSGIRQRFLEDFLCVRRKCVRIPQFQDLANMRVRRCLYCE